MHTSSSQQPSGITQVLSLAPLTPVGPEPLPEPGNRSGSDYTGKRVTYHWAALTTAGWTRSEWAFVGFFVHMLSLPPCMQHAPCAPPSCRAARHMQHGHHGCSDGLH